MKLISKHYLALLLVFACSFYNPIFSAVETNPCTTGAIVGVVTANDADGDGINNDCDLDDDNDGILDIEECTVLIGETLFEVENGASVNFSLTPVGTGFVLDITNMDNSFNLIINGTPLTTQEIQFQQSGTTTGQNIRFKDGSLWGKNGIPQIYQFQYYGTVQPETPLVRFVIDENLDVKMYASKVSNGPLFELELFNGNAFNNFIWNATSSNNFIVSQEVVGATYIFGRVYGTFTDCDVDNDGIDNYLDLDSDGDGCFDVVESGGLDANNDGIADGSGFTNDGLVSGSTGTYDGLTGFETTAHSFNVSSTPTNKTIAYGNSTSFTIEATSEEATSYTNGNPVYGTAGNANDKIIYQWYLGDPLNGGVVIANSGVYSGVNTSTLSISDVTGLDNLNYYVTISHANNACISETANATLREDTCNDSPTSAALGFNVFTLNGLELSTNETEGAVATGGDLTISGNYQITTNDAGSFEVNNVPVGLVVGGKVNYNSGNALQVNQNTYVKIGESNGAVVWYQDQNSAFAPIRITNNSNYNANPRIALQANANQLGVSSTNNSVFESNVIDFASAFQTLKNNSISLSTNTNNADLTNPNGQSISNTGLPNQVKINLQDGVNYLNILGSDLNNVSLFTYNNKPSDSKVLVINVDASGTFDWNVWNQAGVGQQDAPYIIYNFYNTTTLNIEGNSTIEGTVLAPNANIVKTVNQSNIEGQVIANSFKHAGGEVHSANFTPTIGNCSVNNGVAPTAEFSLNESTQCLVGNSFEFTNNSNTGNNVQTGNPITYVWNFGDNTTSTLMNPTKVYETAGTYTVTLEATNSFGTDTYTKEVIVREDLSITLSTSSVDNSNGSVTKNFTVDNSTNFVSYSWSLLDQNKALIENLTSINATASVTISTAGLYYVEVAVVDVNGCAKTQLFPVTVTSDEVTGGNGGGVESESLGDAISKIYVSRKKNSVPTNFVKSDANLYNKAKLKQAQPYQGKGQTLFDMFPTELVAGNVANVTSPTDILDYTIADEVLSVDFSLDGKTKGVVLGIKTSDKIYNHTKASCDRLRGAEILNIQKVQLEGYNFLMQGIKQRNGVVEYAISFATAKNNNDANYTIQTNWYVNNYIRFNDVYNFQVWSTNPQDTQKLVKDVLNNLKSFMPVTQTEIQKVPKTFAAKISREKSELLILLRSTQKGLNTEISMEEIYSETANNVKHRYNPVNTELEQTLRMDIADGYEYDGLVKVDGEIEDAFYHADGNWGLDYDKNYTEIENYFVWNNFNRDYKDDEHAINRSVEIKAKSEYDYLTIYKSLLPGTLSADYSEYNYVAFTAKGSGLMELGLIKSSTEDWKAQYRVMVDLSEEEHTYYVPFEIFASSATTNTITADDLTTLTFTFLPVEAQTKELDLVISDVRFTKVAVDEETVNKIEKFENEFMAYPNPSKGNVNVLLFSEYDTEAIVTLTDINGKTIYSGTTNLTVGKNELDYNFNVKPGVLFLKVTSQESDFGTSKILFR